MKNIKSQAYRFTILFLVVCTSCLSLKGLIAPEREVSQINDSRINGLQDTIRPLFPESNLYSISYECQVTFEGKDPITGERKKELAYYPLFSHTAPHIKPYLPGKDLLEAEAKMIKFGGGYTYLSILFHWNAKDPVSAYGRLKSKAAIRCHLTQGKSVTLYNSTESTWQQGDDLTSHSMLAKFLLHPRQVKLIKNYPVQHLTVYWERGYEVYPIFPITIFQDQLGCLE